MSTSEQKRQVYNAKSSYRKKGLDVPKRVIDSWNPMQKKLYASLVAKEAKRRDLPKQTTSRASIKQRSLSNTAMIQLYKECKGCEECGAKGLAHYQLDLDHIDPRTKHTYSNRRAVFPSWSLDRIEAELKKCRVLCKNCHAKKTIENNDHKPSKRHKENVNVQTVMHKDDVLRILRLIQSS